MFSSHTSSKHEKSFRLTSAAIWPMVCGMLPLQSGSRTGCRLSVHHLQTRDEWIVQSETRGSTLEDRSQHTTEQKLEREREKERERLHR